MNVQTCKIVLLSAAVYNLSGGISILFLLETLAPLVHFEDHGNMLFRLFAGGTAITFGLAYLCVGRSGRYRDPVLLFGTGLKYWAFVAALTAYVFFDLSLAMLLLFGAANLCFALLFTLIIRSNPGVPSAPL